jgi:peptide/nickel transport system substrate-binding protein
MPITHKARLAAVVALVAAAIALTGCSASSSTVSSAAATPVTLTTQTAKPSGDIDHVNWLVYAEPLSLDYAYAFDYPDNQVLSNVCESLLRLNPNWTLSPGLATSYEHPNPLTWVYDIRQGVRFHDGGTMTAADVVASMERQMNPEVGSSWADVYQFVTSIKQTGPYQVTVTTSRPDSQFNLNMANDAGMVESAAYLQKEGKNYGNSTGLVDCTGPFEVTNWTQGQSITLKKFDGYWDPSLMAKANTFTFTFMSDTTSQVNALKSGAADGMWMVDPSGFAALTKSGAGTMYYGLNTTVNSLIVNNLKGPLGNLKVRQALMMALDREGMTKATTGGIGTVANALTTPSVWKSAGAANTKAAFTGLDTYGQNLAEAKKLVKEAGAEGKQIVIATAPLGNAFSIVSQGTAAAAQSIGLKAKIDTVTPEQFSELFSDPNARKGIDLIYTSWYLSSPDSMEMWATLESGQFSNYGDWNDPTYDKLVAKGLQIDDPVERGAISVQAQHIVNQQLPWLPLNTSPMDVFLGKRITGVSPSIAFLYYPWAATIGKR